MCNSMEVRSGTADKKSDFMGKTLIYLIISTNAVHSSHLFADFFKPLNAKLNPYCQLTYSLHGAESFLKS